MSGFRCDFLLADSYRAWRNVVSSLVAYLLFAPNNIRLGTMLRRPCIMLSCHPALKMVVLVAPVSALSATRLGDFFRLLPQS